MFYTCNICERREEFKFSIVSPSLRILGKLACIVSSRAQKNQPNSRKKRRTAVCSPGKRCRAEILRNSTFPPSRHWTKNMSYNATSLAAVNIVRNTVPDDTSKLPRRARILSKRGRSPPSIDRLVKCPRATVPSSRYGTCLFGQEIGDEEEREEGDLSTRRNEGTPVLRYSPELRSSSDFARCRCGCSRYRRCLDEIERCIDR